MTAQLTPERDFRGPGCSEDCRVLRVFQAGVFGRQDILVHDPESHERYGRMVAGDAGAFNLLETGLLAIDRDHMVASVGARQVTFSPTEWRLLLALADRIGRLVPYRDLLRAGWPQDPLDRFSLPMIRVNMARIRGRLGTGAAGLIKTRTGIGIELLLWPVGQPIPPSGIPTNGPFKLIDRWSVLHERCVECGTTDRPHRGHGVCESSRCRERYAARMAKGGAP